jgi:hypothetical protein
LADENKTRPTAADVDAFLDAVGNDRRREDARALCRLMRQVTGEEPVLWGPSIVGFGRYHYRYASGREGDAGAAGFSPRKSSLTIYVPDGFERYRDLLERLGPHTTSVSCLYVKRLDAVDLDVLRELVARSYRHVTTAMDAPEGGA